MEAIPFQTATWTQQKSRSLLFDQVQMAGSFHSRFDLASRSPSTQFQTGNALSAAPLQHLDGSGAILPTSVSFRLCGEREIHHGDDTIPGRSLDGIWDRYRHSFEPNRLSNEPGGMGLAGRRLLRCCGRALLNSTKPHVHPYQSFSRGESANQPWSCSRVRR